MASNEVSELSQFTSNQRASDEQQSRSRSSSPDDEDIEIVNYQDYLSFNVNLYDFSQVIFLEVKDTYAPGENVECKYKVTNALHPHARDRVCLFRLGWISPQDYKTYMWALCPNDYTAGTVFDSMITFSAAFVPQESSENYYQFCYINHQDQIRGASTPFQFKESQTELNNGNVSIGSQMIEELNDRVDCLNQEREQLIREISGKEDAILELKRRIEVLERQLEDHDELILLESQQKIDIDELNKKVEALTTENAQKKREKDALSVHYEFALEQRKAAELEHGEMYETLVKQAANLRTEKSEVENDLAIMRIEKEDLEKRYKDLEFENAKLVEKIEIAKEEHSDVLKLFEARQNDIEELKIKLAESDQASRKLMEEYEAQRRQMITLQAEFEECQAQKQQIPDQLAGPVYALKKALDHTQSKLEQANLAQDKLKTEVEITRKQLALRSEEVKAEKAFTGDLLVRLDMAKLSYKMKYVEAGRYRRELKNVLRQDKSLFRKVSDDIEQQIKEIEAEWKLPSEQAARHLNQQQQLQGARDTSERTLSLCNDATMEEFFTTRMVTAIEDEVGSVNTDSVYMDATPNNVPNDADLTEVSHASESATPKNEENEKKGAPTAADADNSALWREAQEKIQKQLNSITPWKLNDLCLITCLDNLDRLAYIADIDKPNKSVVVRVAYQMPKSVSESVVDSVGGSVQMVTRLEMEEAPFDRIRPYKGEQVPRDVWLTICESLFTAGVESETAISDSVADISSPVACSTLAANKGKPTLKSLATGETQNNEERDSVLSTSLSSAGPSIGGVGWGALGASRMTGPLKSMISTGAGAAADLMGGLASSVATATSSGFTVSNSASGSGHASGQQDSSKSFVNSLVSSVETSGEWPNRDKNAPAATDDGVTAAAPAHPKWHDFNDNKDRGSSTDMNKCLLCEKTFPRDVSPEVFNTHMEEHYGPSCPFCNLRFPKTNKGEWELNNHVNVHLAEMGDM